MKAWKEFRGQKWKDEISVGSFIQDNYEPFSGDESFLVGSTKRTQNLRNQIERLENEFEQTKFPMDTKIVSNVASHEAGYVDKDSEVIIGLQTDEPFKLAFMPHGGLRTAEQCLRENGYEVDELTHDFFVKNVTTVNEGIFHAYTKDIKKARHSHIVSGLPDSYARGRIIGKYDRLALYGADRLILEKQNDLDKIKVTDEKSIQLREEVWKQIEALKDLIELGKM